MPFQWNTLIKDCVTSDGVATLSCIPAVFQNVIGGALLFAGIAGIVLVIYSGFKYINSGGDPKQLEGARSTLVYALLGLTIILVSFLIVNIIAYITGTNCIAKIGFSNCK